MQQVLLRWLVQYLTHLALVALASCVAVLCLEVPFRGLSNPFLFEITLSFDYAFEALPYEIVRCVEVNLKETAEIQVVNVSEVLVLWLVDRDLSLATLLLCAAIIVTLKEPVHASDRPDKYENCKKNINSAFSIGKALLRHILFHLMTVMLKMLFQKTRVDVLEVLVDLVVRREAWR